MYDHNYQTFDETWEPSVEKPALREEPSTIPFEDDSVHAAIHSNEGVPLRSTDPEPIAEVEGSSEIAYVEPTKFCSPPEPSCTPTPEPSRSFDTGSSYDSGSSSYDSGSSSYDSGSSSYDSGGSP